MIPISFEAWKERNLDLVESAKVCKRCDGRKYMQCPGCKGDGGIESFNDNGHYMRACYDCHGESEITCTRCEGDGTDLRDTFNALVEKETKMIAGMSIMNTSDFRVTQILWMVSEHRDYPRRVRIVSIGRKWLTLDNGRRVNIETLRSGSIQCYRDEALALAACRLEL